MKNLLIQFKAWLVQSYTELFYKAVKLIYSKRFNDSYMLWNIYMFRSLPIIRDKWSTHLMYDSLIVLPRNKGLHDSGFAYIDFVVIKNGKAIGRAGNWSDVIHLGGIGGGKFEDISDHIDWSIDILPTSKLCHIFCSYDLYDKGSYSSFEIIPFNSKYHPE